VEAAAAARYATTKSVRVAGVQRHTQRERLGRSAQEDTMIDIVVGHAQEPVFNK